MFSIKIKTNYYLLTSILLLILTTIISFFIFSKISIFYQLDLKWRDTLFSIRGPLQPDENIVICTLDEESFEVLEEELPFSAKTYIKFFENLKKIGVKVVGLDFILYEYYKSTPDTNDILLKNAIDSIDEVVFAAKIENYFKKQRLGTLEITLAGNKLKFSNSFFTKGKTFGLINSTINFDGVKRDMNLILEYDNKTYESFVLKLYESYLKTLPEELAKNYIPVNELVKTRNNLIINYAGGPRTFLEIPFYAIVEMPESSINKLREKYKNKIFILGPTFYESHDFFIVPFSNTRHVKGFQSMAGVEVIANALHTLLKKDFLDFIPKFKYNLIFFISNISLIICFFIFKNIFWNLLITLLLTILIFNYSINLFIYDKIIFNISLIIFTFLINYFCYIIINSILVEREKKYLKSIFDRYVSPKVIDKILAQNETLSLKGDVVEVAVMFIDVRNFTAISEKLNATLVVKLLNNFFEKMVNIIFNYEGTLDKYIGDCIMVIFGAPNQLKNPASLALECAIKMQEEIIKMNKTENLNEKLFAGIGISYGKCVVGNIGSLKRMEYTAIGDTVNTASRIQNLALENEIIISESLYKKILTEDNNENLKNYLNKALKLENVEVKGKNEKLNLYKIIISNQ